MGYSDQQVRDLEAPIDRVRCDVVIVGTPMDLSWIVKIRQPVVRARYELQEIGQPDLAHVVDDFLRRHPGAVPKAPQAEQMVTVARSDPEC
jgi:predicted GTPase